MQKPSRDYKGNAWMQSCFLRMGVLPPNPRTFSKQQARYSSHPCKRKPPNSPFGGDLVLEMSRVC